MALINLPSSEGFTLYLEEVLISSQLFPSLEICQLKLRLFELPFTSNFETKIPPKSVFEFSPCLAPDTYKVPSNPVVTE